MDKTGARKQPIDIPENELLEQYPSVLDILLYDHTTQKNILWGTSNYEHLGKDYHKSKPIEAAQITGTNGNLIVPRVQKDASLQFSRVKNMAEVFTPSWVCNAQNNLIDTYWFGRENVFNKEVKSDEENRWEMVHEKVVFPKNKTWEDYVMDRRLEITCGEAPYITSRYDTTTGKFIEVADRIGLLDRKLRVIHENVHDIDVWLQWTQMAYQSTYAYEWQGDSLLLAREAMLFSFIENYKHKFGEEPSLPHIQNMAYIISWNVWQMDGLKGVVPYSCGNTVTTTINLFGEKKTDNAFCSGCLHDDIFKHNGAYCIIKDWTAKDKESGKYGKKTRFVDLMKN